MTQDNLNFRGPLGSGAHQVPSTGTSHPNQCHSSHSSCRGQSRPGGTREARTAGTPGTSATQPETEDALETEDAPETKDAPETEDALETEDAPETEDALETEAAPPEGPKHREPGPAPRKRAPAESRVAASK